MAAFFTELFRIARTDVESLLDPELERDSESSLWLRQLGDLELVGLWECLPNAIPAGTLMHEVLAEHEGALLVFSLPENFLDSIESISDTEIEKSAKKWSAMEELVNWEIEDLVQVIRDIRELVRDAKSKNQIVVQLAEV